MTNVGRRRGLACTRRDYDDDWPSKHFCTRQPHTRCTLYDTYNACNVCSDVLLITINDNVQYDVLCVYEYADRETY